MKKKSEAIILRRLAYADADWIVSFFTRDLGRMSGIAKSARSSVKRFGAALEPGSLVEICYSEKVGRDLVIVDNAAILRPINGIMRSLSRLQCMGFVLNLAYAFLPERLASPDKFFALNNFLEKISLNDPSDKDLIEFQLSWLKLCGFASNVQEIVRQVGMRPNDKMSVTEVSNMLQLYIGSVLGYNINQMIL